MSALAPSAASNIKNIVNAEVASDTDRETIAREAATIRFIKVLVLQRCLRDEAIALWYRGEFGASVDLSGLLSRVLAQTEVTFSNSLIESWWRVLNHQWLYLNTMDSAKTVEKLVVFYVQERNARLPHAAFRGQTPDEMYWNTGVTVPTELEAARQQARQARAKANRQRTCSACEPVTVNLN